MRTGRSRTVGRPCDTECHCALTAHKRFTVPRTLW